MIINIRGTHGSGKSTLVRQLLDAFPNEALGGGKKPDGYKVSISWLKKPVYVVGSYKTACGGCDAIQPYDLIWPRVEQYAEQGSVLFEGALVSSSYGNIGRASESYGKDFVFAFMDTPLDVCLDRIRKRREQRGDLRPLNPKNTEGKYNSILRSIDKIRDMGRVIVMVPHEEPLVTLKRILIHGR